MLLQNKLKRFDIAGVKLFEAVRYAHFHVYKTLHKRMYASITNEEIDLRWRAELAFYISPVRALQRF